MVILWFIFTKIKTLSYLLIESAQENQSMCPEHCREAFVNSPTLGYFSIILGCSFKHSGAYDVGGAPL